MNNTKKAFDMSKSIVMPKSKHKSALTIIIISLSILIITALSAALFFNVGGLRDTLNFSKMAQNTVANDRQKALDNLSKQLQDEKSNLEILDAGLNVKKNELDEKQRLLEQAQSEVEELKNKLQARITEIQDLTKLYEKMEPETAAQIMMQYPDKTVVANIIKNMSTAKAAQILGEMDAKSASQLLQLLSQ